MHRTSAYLLAFVVVVANSFRQTLPFFRYRPSSTQQLQEKKSSHAPPSWRSAPRMVSTDDEKITVAAGNVQPPFPSLPSHLRPHAEQFITAWRNALQGDQLALSRLLPSTARWENPFVATGKELSEGLAQFSAFVSEPALTVFDVTSSASGSSSSSNSLSVEVRYHLSFWYPMAWRPRIVIPGRAAVTFNPDGTVASVVERWDASWWDIVTRQFLPRWWDILHVFCTPSPEYPPIRALSRAGNVAFVELPETVVYEAQWSGAAKFPGPPLLAAPGFSLFGYLRTSNPNKVLDISEPYHYALPHRAPSHSPTSLPPLPPTRTRSTRRSRSRCSRGRSPTRSRARRTSNPRGRTTSPRPCKLK